LHWRQARRIARVFEVKKMGRLPFGQLPRQCCLAGLARTDQRDNRKLRQQATQSCQVSETWDVINNHEYLYSISRYSWL
jgi:hypothetical protein